MENEHIEIPAGPLADPNYKPEKPKEDVAEKPEKNVYSGIDDLPSGTAGDKITEGCIVLEGGGWRGLYTLGVLDCLMQNDINIRNAIGISAGALSALGYISGQIGWGARIDLRYRHNSDYVGIGALRRDHGVTGFSYLFGEVLEKEPIDKKRLNDPSRRLVVGVTNMLTGQTEYMEKGNCNLSAAIRASATVPYVSRPVVIDGVPYLDGGCSTKIPYKWAMDEGFDKIVVVKTREWGYLNDDAPGPLLKRMYAKYPEFVSAMEASDEEYDSVNEELERLHNEGIIYAIAPSIASDVSRFEGDMEKLGEFYWLGFNDAKDRLDDLRKYLGISV